MPTEVQPVPVDTSGDADEPNHVACVTLDRTWCGLDASDIRPLTEPWPGLETFCRVCLLAIEMHPAGAPCPVCGTMECIA